MGQGARGGMIMITDSMYFFNLCLARQGRQCSLCLFHPFAFYLLTPNLTLLIILKQYNDIILNLCRIWCNILSKFVYFSTKFQFFASFSTSSPKWCSGSQTILIIRDTMSPYKYEETEMCQWPSGPFYHELFITPLSFWQAIDWSATNLELSERKKG